MVNETNGGVTAFEPSSYQSISMLMTDPRVGAAPFAQDSVLHIGALGRDERQRNGARMTGAIAQGAGPRARVSSLQVEKSALIRSAFDPRQGFATTVLSPLPSYISTGVSADEAGTAYGPVRYQEHPPAA